MTAANLSRLRYVVITPARNEAGCIGRTIDSMAEQTLLPTQWVIVDDGSSDGTGAILRAASRNHTWLTTIQRPDRGFRKSGGGVVDAFYDGYSALQSTDWDFIAKLDGDVSFGPRYFETCLSHFADEPRLGVGGGTIYVMEKGRLKIDSPKDPPFHVRGATKIYRRACWQEVQPLVAAPGWDTVDEVRANMLGWHTRTFVDAHLVQHRATGAVDGDWRNSFKNGRANYVSGYHPAFMFAKCVRSLCAGPHVVAATAMWAGFCSGYLKKQSHVADASTVRYIRQQQVRCLLLQPSIYRATKDPSRPTVIDEHR